jgi:NifU-like protein involved in Fe-S cluster formation
MPSLSEMIGDHIKGKTSKDAEKLDVKTKSADPKEEIRQDVLATSAMEDFMDAVKSGDAKSAINFLKECIHLSKDDE